MARVATSRWRDAAVTHATWNADTSLALVAATALAIGCAHRLLVGWDAPLWLDETFTAAIATQPDLAGLVRWHLNELSGPIWYALIWSWQQIAGDGNTALRLPSLACSIATPLLILWRGHPDARLRLIWAGFVAVWVPGLLYASEARPYTLIFLLASVQAIAFSAMMRAPAPRAVLAWCAVTAVALLTHFHVAFISLLQGVAFLAVHRRRALAMWPAALAFVPVVAWMAVHLPVLARFASPDVAWYRLLQPAALLALPNYLLGGGAWGAMLLLVIGATTLACGVRAATGRSYPHLAAGDVLLAACGVLSIAIVIGIGFVRPTFTSRYLLPSMPAFLFGFSLWVRTVERRYAQAGTLLLAGAVLFAAQLLAERLRAPADDARYIYNFERPTDWLRAQGMRRMVFIWDNPGASITTDEHLRELGGFFNWRAGRPVPVLTPRLPLGADLDTALATLATPGTGVLWAFDLATPGAMAARRPSRVRHDPRLTCLDFGRANITVLACIAHPPARTP